MPQLGTGSYPTSTAIAADDKFVGVVNGSVEEVPGSILRTFAAPAGLIDAADQTALTETVLNNADATTGWAAFGAHGGGSPAVDTSIKTTGTGSIKLALQTTLGTASKLYYTFTSPQSTTGRTLVAFDLRVASDGPSFHSMAEFTARVADGVTISAGNMNSFSLSGTPRDSWTTILLPLTGLTEIKSIGVIRTDTSTGGSLHRTIFWIDNVRFIAETKINQALGTSNEVAWVPPNYTPDANQFPIRLSTTQGLIDPTKGVYSKANNVVWLHDALAHVVGAETGATNVATTINQIINSATYGQTVKASPGAIYRFDSDMIFTNKGVTLDFTGAICFLTYTTNTPFFTFSACQDVKVIGGLWLGYYPRTQNGSLMTDVSGTVTSGTTKVLDAQNDECKLQDHGSWNYSAHFARHMPQQVGEADDGLGPRWYFDFTLSDTAQVANDCVISIYNDITDELLETETFTLTGTPTSYRISHVPEDVMTRARVTVKKATATANTITVTSFQLWGENEYSATYDIASAFLISTSGYVTIGDCWIEGFGGDAIQISDATTHHVYNYGFRSHACRRQGASYNQGTDILLEDFAITAPGRSGLDFEPFATDWFTRNVVVRNGYFDAIANYAFAMTNWARNFDFRIYNIDIGECGIGASIGGFQGGSVRNITLTYPNTSMSISGRNVVVENIYATGRVTGSGSSSEYDGTTYEPENNVLRNVFVNNTSADVMVYVLDGWRYENVSLTDGTVTDYAASVGNNALGPVRMSADAMQDFAQVHVGEYNEQFPNTFKAPYAYSSVWVPGGFSHYDEPTYSLRSLSGTTTKGNNLRGVNVAVTATASSLAVTFPTRSVGQFTSFTAAGTSSTTGTLANSTTYYYRLAPRGRVAGPGTYLAQQSGSTSASQTAIQLVINGPISHVNEIITAGFTVIRGTTNGGPYTTRYDVTPAQAFYGLGNANIAFWDQGSTGVLRDMTADVDRAYGYALSYAASSGSWTGSVNETGYEPDTSYAVIVTPSWLTTVRVTSKTTAGFTVEFGTAAPVGATVDWFLVR